MIACGGCTDLSIGLRLPFISSWCWLMLAWLLAVIVLRLAWPAAATVLGLPRGWASVVIGVLVVGGWIVLASSIWVGWLVPAFLILPIWIVYLMVKFAQSAQRCPSRSKRGPAVGFHGCWLAALLLVLAYAVVRSGSIAHLVAYLNTHSRDQAGVVVPGLIARGEEAVGPLICATEAAVGSDDWHALRASLLCLARIGGPDAEGCLARIVSQVGADGTDWQLWHRCAFAAYAECAEARSVPTLMETYNRVRDRDKWSVLAAWAKTRTPEALAFVFTHIDALFEGAESKLGDRARTARLTLHVLLSEPDVDALRDLPLYRHIFVFGGVRSAPGTEKASYQYFFWTSEDDSLTAAELRKIWKENANTIREQWSGALSGASQ